MIIDFTPYYDKTQFRYTGSNAERVVLHFGWPMPLFIYDSSTPPHWFSWPLPFFAIPLQIFLLLFILCINEWDIRRLEKRTIVGDSDNK